MKKEARVREGAAVSAFGPASVDKIDYGQFYDKINARGMCDDLVLLEDVSNEGIVEVGDWLASFWSILKHSRVANAIKD